MIYLKHLGIFVDTVHQFMMNDFKNPLMKQIVKREFNRWLSVSDKLVTYYKKEMGDEAEVELFEEKVSCLYEVAKIIFSVPSEELENITETFKNLNKVIEQSKKENE